MILKTILEMLTGKPGPKPVPNASTVTFNEAVNFEKRTIFVAIPKTGTTSVSDQLRVPGKALIPHSHLNLLQIRDGLYTYFLLTHLNKNRSFPSGETKTDAEVRLLSKKTFDEFFKFSAVRNPWARALSMYRRREATQLNDVMSFEEFCDRHFYCSDTCWHPTLHQNQLDWLCDESGKIGVDYFYKVENFAQAIKDIEERTDGRLRLEMRYANVNPQSRSQTYRDFYSPQTRKIISERFVKDIEFFGYEF